MTPKERLKEIEDQGQGTISDEAWDEFKWLIGRVKRLTEALEKIEEEGEDHSYTIALEALTEGEMK